MAQKTALYDHHIALDGHMVEFAGTWLPVRYQSESAEHMAVRTKVGIFDISHMGEFFIEGIDAVRFLQKILTNDADSLAIGQAHYTLLLNDQAGIIDDLILYRLESDRFLLCVNASNIDKDFLWIKKHAEGFQVSLENASAKFSLIALQGPKALPLLRSITKEELPSRFFAKNMSLGGHDCLVAHTGYTGEEGVEIFIENRDAIALWQLLLKKGEAFGITPCGLSARDSLRLEAGMMLWGQDMDENINPKEAGLMFAVAQKKDFNGKRALLTKIEQGVSKKLMGFCLEDRGIARHGAQVVDKDGAPLGVVTSGTFLPEKKIAIGFAYVSSKLALGQEVYIDIRGRASKAKLVKPRFLF